MEEKSYTKILSTDTTKANLMAAAVYLTAYELMMSAIIEQLRNYFFIGRKFMEQDYQKHVLSLDKNTFAASCSWLEKMEAITKEDIDDILKIREHRHKIAHELPNFLVDDAVNINIAYIYKMYELLTKIDVWWFMQNVLPLDSDASTYTDEIVSVKSGPILILERLLSLLPSGQQFSDKKN